MTTSVYYDLFPSTLGAMLLSSDGDALTGAWFDGQRHQPALGPSWERRPKLPILLRAEVELAEYFAGERTVFTLPLAPAGTPFQRDVWSAIAAIPYGETTRLSRSRCAYRAPGQHSRGRRGHGAQSAVDHRAVPSRAGRRRDADRVRGRARPQARAARAREPRAGGAFGSPRGLMCPHAHFVRCPPRGSKAALGAARRAA